MPRIRTLKPEHRQHRKVGALSHRQYRLWVGLICEADDAGRLVASAASLRVIIFGYHPDVGEAELDADLDHLARVGLIRVYSVNRTRYAMLPDWSEHQRIDRPRSSRLPAPSVHERSSKPRRALDECSTNARRPFDDHSTTIRGGSDRKGSRTTEPLSIPGVDTSPRTRARATAGPAAPAPPAQTRSAHAPKSDRTAPDPTSLSTLIDGAIEKHSLQATDRVAALKRAEGKLPPVAPTATTATTATPDEEQTPF